MTTTPSPITPTLPSGYTVPSSVPTQAQAASNGINANTFLKLLVAQLQYQDPNNPSNPTQYLTQTAAFEEVQQLDSLQTSVQALTQQQQVSSGVAMLGQKVTASTGTSGSSVSGVVSAVQLTSTGPVLTVAGQQVPLSAVQSVTAAASGSSSTTTTPPSSTTTTPTTTA
ncbi:MAG TPA: flagellar hook capping FlgD N-terminal domain-containing protein [Acidimicrobiales bacterium]|nr:flagellar hook capping FlgD N-terminal domain-containing protein [Acidimicrobiales bacterium]